MARRLSSILLWGLASRPRRGLGHQYKPTRTQEKIVLRWLSGSPTEYGVNTDLWSTPRLAYLIEQEVDIHFNPHYLSTWLRQRGYIPQKPRRMPRERDDNAISSWLANDWPRIKNKAHRRNACLLLMDKSRLLMAPLLRGHPAESKFKGGHREKVSVAAALWLPPDSG